MPATLRIDNYASSNRVEISSLDADAAAGATSLTLRNTQGYAALKNVIVGSIGDDGAEMRAISSVTNATTLVLSTALSFNHKRFEAFTSLFGNQIKVYRAANVNGVVPPDTSFSNVATIAIEPEQLYTDYTDATGGSGFWYKFTYYDGTNETPLADAVGVRGGGWGHYVSVDDIRNNAGFANNRNVTDASISAHRDRAEAEINNALAGIYSIPLASPVNPYIENIAMLLAAGFLMQDEFQGTFTGVGVNSVGADKVKQARDMLSEIKDREVSLADTAGNILAATSLVDSWPNTTTSTATEDESGGDHLFRIKHQY